MENYTEELKKNETQLSGDEITVDDIKTGKYTVKDLEEAGWERYRDAWTMGYVFAQDKNRRPAGQSIRQGRGLLRTPVVALYHIFCACVYEARRENAALNPF